MHLRTTEQASTKSKMTSSTAKKSIFIGIIVLAIASILTAYVGVSTDFRLKDFIAPHIYRLAKGNIMKKDSTIPEPAKVVSTPNRIHSTSLITSGSPVDFVSPNLPNVSFQSTRAAVSIMPPASASRDFMEEQANIHRLRRDRLKDACQTFGNDVDSEGPNLGTSIIVDDKYKLMYCYVPKVACTSWKRVFLVLNGVMKYLDELPQPVVNNKVGPRKLKFIRSFNVSKHKEILQNYTKFLVVRQPFQRLLSAYNNKLYAGSTSPSALPFQKTDGVHILDTYRLNNSHLYDTKTKRIELQNRIIDYNLQFEEFVRFLTNSSEPSHRRNNPHWKEIYKTCWPCHIQYDVISHFETLETDANYILRLVKADGIVHFPSANGSSPTHSSDQAIYKTHYSQVSPEDLQRLYERYRPDFELFGYEKPSFEET
ncbi:carbohydrate sulfotransferase 11-like [Diadema antillarum]|uniref:carbohydrate sulfotransferase 11-like n=1 Tax=Diadema antillarum TaxID=105358 RepID=UPI003A8A0AB9